MRHLQSFKIIIAGIILFSVRSQAAYNPGDSLTIEWVVESAMRYHPSIVIASSATRAAQGALQSARSALYPSINASASYTRQGGAFVLSPSIPSRSQTYTTYTTGVSATATLFDFGKTFNKISSGSDLVQASASDEALNTQNVVTNALIAYFAYIQAIGTHQVNQETVLQAQDHLRQAQAFYKAGTRPQLDVIKAEVALGNAQVGEIQSRNLVQTAATTLANAVGVPLPPGKPAYIQVEIQSPASSLDSARQMGLLNRPDIFSAIARMRANSALVSSAWDQHLPTLAATAAWNWTSFNFPLVNRWNAGVTFSLPIFQGMGISAQVQQAEAQYDASKATVELVRQAAVLDIEQSYLAVQELHERIDAIVTLVEQSKEGLRLAERQYAAGVGTMLDVTDAQVSLANAKLNEVQARTDLDTALIRLRRAVGLNVTDGF